MGIQELEKAVTDNIFKKFVFEWKERELAEAGEGTLGSEMFWSGKSSATCHMEACSEQNISYCTETKSRDSPSHGPAPI